MGYLRGVFHGLVIGGAVALLYAPKPGREMRQDLQDQLDQLRGQVQPMLDQAQGVVQSARPVVSRAQQQAQKITGRGPGSSSQSYTDPASMDAGGAPAPGD